MLRIKPASETLSILRERLDDYGISRVADLSYLDQTSNLYIFSAIRPASRSLTTSLGKSTEKESAQCSAIVESIEAFYAESVEATYAAHSQFGLLAEGHLILPQIWEEQGMTILPEQLMEWCIGRTLLSNQVVAIPHALLSLDSTRLMPFHLRVNSDGLASGNCFTEALIYSFLECYERQVIRQKKKQVIKVPSHLLDCQVSHEVEMQFFYYPNVLDLPVVACEINNRNPLLNQCVITGYGCHLDYRQAINRALNEAIQSKVGLIAGSRDDITQTSYQTKRSHDVVNHDSSVIPHFDNKADLSLAGQLNDLKERLQACTKDLVYFIYEDQSICVVKTFLVDYE